MKTLNFSDLPNFCIFTFEGVEYEKRSTRTAQRLSVDGAFYFKQAQQVLANEGALKAFDDFAEELTEGNKMENKGRYKISGFNWDVYSDSAKDVLSKAQKKSGYLDSHPMRWCDSEGKYKDISFPSLHQASRQELVE